MTCHVASFDEQVTRATQGSFGKLDEGAQAILGIICARQIQESCAGIWFPIS